MGSTDLARQSAVPRGGRIMPGPGDRFHAGTVCTSATPGSRRGKDREDGTGPTTRAVRRHSTMTSGSPDQANAAADALNESDLRLRTLAAAAFEGIVFSEQGRIVDANAQFAAIVGREPADLIGTEIADLVAPEDRERVVANIKADRQSVIEHAVITGDGRRVFVEAHGRPMDYRGRLVRVTAVRDISERKREQERTAAPEPLAAGAATQRPGAPACDRRGGVPEGRLPHHRRGLRAPHGVGRPRRR